MDEGLLGHLMSAKSSFKPICNFASHCNSLYISTKEVNSTHVQGIYLIIIFVGANFSDFEWSVP